MIAPLSKMWVLSSAVAQPGVPAAGNNARPQEDLLLGTLQCDGPENTRRPTSDTTRSSQDQNRSQSVEVKHRPNGARHGGRKS